MAHPLQQYVDKMNRRILTILQKDGRETTAAIARALDRSESSIRERVQRMEAKGIIRGYYACVDKRALGYHSEAFVFCNLDPENRNRILNRLVGMKSVTGIYHVSGERRLLLKVAAEDNERIRDFIHRKLIPLGIRDVDSRIVMDITEKFPPDAVVDG